MAYLGNILLFAGKKAPYGCAFCDGSLLSKKTYDVLFDLIGSTYGDDGKGNFAVPNLNCRVPVGTGKAIDRTTEYVYGEIGGNDQYMLQPANIPNHNHQLSGRVRVHNEGANSNAPESNYFSYAAIDKDYQNKADGTMNANLIAIELIPSSERPVEQKAVNNMQPYIAINYIICIDGNIFPYPSHS
jgi:microcystin-dependent protein